MAYIKSPRRLNPLIRIGISLSEKITGKRMEAARLLGWYPKAAFSSGILESLVAHEEKGISKRLLKLIRMQVSFSASCPFCIDMNSSHFDREGITDDEIRALQGKLNPDQVLTLSKKEVVALEYAKGLTQTPIVIEKKLVKKMKHFYNEKQIVILVTTIAQVNYWTRMIQGFGIQPAGFSSQCDLLDIEGYKTLR